MKNKKEIWKDNGLNPDNFSKAVSDAMNEHAKEQLLGFATFYNTSVTEAKGFVTEGDIYKFIHQQL